MVKGNGWMYECQVTSKFSVNGGEHRVDQEEIRQISTKRLEVSTLRFEWIALIDIDKHSML